MADDIDKTLLDEIKTRAKDLEVQHAARNAMFAEYDEMYLLDWAEKQSARLANMRVTTSPDARNAVDGAIRLMIATEPQINVSEDSGARDPSKIEEWANKQWKRNGRLFGEPIHHALIRMAVLYGEMHCSVTPMFEMVEYVRDQKPETDGEKLYQAAYLAQWERAAKTQNFLVQPIHPANGYPEFGSLGLTAYYRTEKVTVSQLRDRFGYKPEVYKSRRSSDPVNLHSFWDVVYTAYWTDECDLFLQPHDYGFVPVVAQITDGSRMFPDIEDQRQPMLYGMLKSGIWNSQNLALTVMVSSALAMGSITKFVYVPSQPDNKIDFNWDTELATLNPGDQLAPLDMRNIIPAPLENVYQMTKGIGQESTIYPQALGGAPDRTTTFSEASLASQAGRLPLIGPQRRGSWGISGIVEMMLQMGKQTPKYLAGSDLTAGDIPEDIQIDTRLEVTLPQEKLQMANVGAILAQQGLPMEWILTNIYGINQPDKLRRARLKEDTLTQMFQAKAQMMMAQLQQADQQQQVPPAGPQPGDQIPEPAPDEEEFEPQAGAQLGIGQAQRVQGGLPPQQAGAIPGEGQAAVPPEMGDVQL